MSGGAGMQRSNRTVIGSGLQASSRSGLISLETLTGFAPLVTLYVIYTLMRWWLVDRGALIGDDHATAVIQVERWLRIDIERDLQSLVMQSGVLMRAANHYYVYGFFPVLLFATAMAMLRAPAAFGWWRRVFAVSLALAIASFALFPLTPPRLLPTSYGYVDTLLLYGPRYYGDESGGSLFNAWGSLPSMVNVHAAMPSMHVGWSVIASLLLFAAFPGRRLVKGFAILHPFLMGLAVIVTANHYVLDVFAGVGVLGLAYVTTRWLEQYLKCASWRCRVPA